MDLNYLSYLLQCCDLSLNLGQTSNDTLMKELQNQNEKYLKQIIENQNKIIKMLENMSR